MLLRRDLVSFLALLALGGGTIGCGSSSSGAASCEPTSTTLGANGGPDTCSYGQFCATDTRQCQAVTNGGCAEASASGASTWSGSDRAAPVIVSVDGLSTGNSSQCPGVVGIEMFTVRYYAPGGLTSATDFSTWRNAIWIDVDPNAPFRHPDVNLGGALDARAPYGTLQVGICGIESRPAAVYLQNDAGKASNSVCVG